MASRWVQPVAHHLNDDRLWHLNRQSAARAAAIGLFFGLALPFAQFLFAIVAAIALRAHVALAAGLTLVTNPLTIAPIYWLAHRIGRTLMGSTQSDRMADLAQRRAARLAQGDSWMSATWEWVQAAGTPLLIGLLAMAVAAAALGYLVVWLLWRDRARPA